MKTTFNVTAFLLPAITARSVMVESITEQIGE